jgi:hypothetical protein
MTIMYELLHQINAVRVAQAAAAEAAVDTATCPRCGGTAVKGGYHGFVEPERGYGERLIATCGAGHEWAVHEPTFCWEGQP